MSDFADLERDKLLDIAEASAIEIPRLRAINAQMLAALEAARERLDWDSQAEDLCNEIDALISKAKEE